MAVMTERPPASPPYRAYAQIVGIFAGSLAAAGGVARLLGRDPRDHTWLDLVTLSMASFTIRRTSGLYRRAAWSRRSASS